MELYIGNRKYSSWSFRPWIAMKVKGVEFTEVLRRFDDHPERIDFRTFSPSGKVPMLESDGVKVWESLAILEYLAEKTGKLLPSVGDAEYWEARQLLYMQAASVGPMFGQRMHFS